MSDVLFSKFLVRHPVISVAVIVWVFWLVVMTLGHHWHYFEANWFMSIVMAIGSFIAGSTSVGGGAVAFPVMTLGFSIEPNVARDFSLMIQAFGMSAASITIVLSKSTVEWRVIIFSSIGGVVGIIVGIELLSPLLPTDYVKMLFTSFWLSFAIVLYISNRSRDPLERDPELTLKVKSAFLFAGFIGGIVSGLTGSGLDIVVFVALVLGLNVSEKSATPTSVIIMAINSIVGFLWKLSFGSEIAPEAWGYWFVCVPIVVLGAPLGALFIQDRSRLFIANFLYVAIVSQYIVAVFVIQQTTYILVFQALSIILGFILFGYIALCGVIHSSSNTMSSSNISFIARFSKR